MRKLITLHIGRGLALYRPAIRFSAFLSWVSGIDMLQPGRIDLPGHPRVPFQGEGLHPLDAEGVAAHLHAGATLPGVHLATNCATTINAVALACREGELRVVSYAFGTATPWDVDQMMAFWAAREQGSAMSPAAMLLKLGCWP